MNKKLITNILPNSIAEELEIKKGDYVLKINDNEILDIFDYDYLVKTDYLELLIETKEGEQIIFEIEKYEDEHLGIEFENALLDNIKSCSNKCIFCFIDQLPKGMRKTLYFKDDDSRLSFLQGNYITLTNMKEKDIEHIIFYHLSPINISVHTTDHVLRQQMLKNYKSNPILPIIKRFYDANIQLNFQIVLLKNINDNENLKNTIKDLEQFIKKSKSLSVVPVGLTKYRDKLFELEPFCIDDAKNTISIIKDFQDYFLKKYNKRFVFASDEFYIKANLDLPLYEEYEEFPQLENGVGMIRLFEYEFNNHLQNLKINYNISKHVSIVTGKSFYDYMLGLIKKFNSKFPNIKVDVFCVDNIFFGHEITVTGLLTGNDIINLLKDKNLGTKLLIPKNALKQDENIFLDDVTLLDLEKTLNLEVTAVNVNGADFIISLIS